MVDPLILAIDQGTSATKCLLVSGVRGEIVARSSAPIGETHPRPGWVEQDGDEIWLSVQAAAASALGGHDPKSVVAIALSLQRESILLWDRKSGVALSPLVSWQDRRTIELHASLNSPANAAMVRAKSGLPLDPMFSALKAKWLLDHYDPRREHARASQVCLGTVDAWLLSRLADEPLIEVGMASRTQLMDVRRAAWDDDLLALFDIPQAALPRIVPSTGPFPSSRSLAQLPDGVPIRAVMGDSHAALFAHGATVPGQVKATYGTGSSVMGLVASAERLDPGLCLTIAWAADKPALAAEGNIRATGAAFKWMADLLAISPDELARLSVGVSSDGVAFVPGFGGLGAPWWDANAVGLVTGLTLATGREQVARAALEAIAHQVADVVDAVRRSAGIVESLFVDGGPTRNDALMQLQSDLITAPVLRAQDTELSALGVAHMAGLAHGLWNWSDLKALPRSRDEFLPRHSEASVHASRVHWKKAVARSRGLQT